MPILAPSQVATVIPLQVPAPAWAMLAFSFSRPIQADNVITANSPFIYAYSDSVPSTPDSMQSAFTIHQAYGSLPAVNFLSVKPVTAVGSAGAGAVPTDQPKPPKNAVVNGAQNVTASCIDGSTFCLYGTPDENKNVLFTVHAAGNGYAL